MIKAVTFHVQEWGPFEGEMWWWGAFSWDRVTLGEGRRGERLAGSESFTTNFHQSSEAAIRLLRNAAEGMKISLPDDVQVTKALRLSK